MSQFSETERNIISIARTDNNFTYKGVLYTIDKVDKPSCSSGEPKTDVYISVKDNDNNVKEFKISIKQSNADFLENKMSDERAKQLFGDNWKNLIISMTTDLRNEFENKKLIFKERYKKTEKGVFTLGWKFELLNKCGGELSKELSSDLLYETYTGNSLNEDKKNAIVNGIRVNNSGIANFILEVDTERPFNNIQDVINNLKTVEEYISTNNRVFFACKALNLRTKANGQNGTFKFDGDRPLSVYVDWSVNPNNKLVGNLNFNNPLITRGNSVAENLRNCFNKLNIVSTDDITNVNLIDYSIVNE